MQTQQRSSSKGATWGLAILFGVVGAAIQSNVSGFFIGAALGALIAQVLYLHSRTQALDEQLQAIGRLRETVHLVRQAVSEGRRASVLAKVEVVGSIATTFEGIVATMARTLFVNHGKTPAIIINMSGTPYLMSNAPQQLARTPDDERRLPEGWVIASGEPFQRPIEIGLTDPQLKAIHDGTLQLYCAGLIRYKDILGDERAIG